MRHAWITLVATLALTPPSTRGEPAAAPSRAAPAAAPSPSDGIAETPAPSAAPTAAKRPASWRRPLDQHGRDGTAWTMREQERFLRACRPSLARTGDALSNERRCRCVLHGLQQAYPRRPPERFDPVSEAELRARCSPGPEADAASR